MTDNQPWRDKKPAAVPERLRRWPHLGHSMHSVLHGFVSGSSSCWFDISQITDPQSQKFPDAVTPPALMASMRDPNLCPIERFSEMLMGASASTRRLQGDSSWYGVIELRPVLGGKELRFNVLGDDLAELFSHWIPG